MSRELNFRTLAGFMFIALAIALPSMSMDFTQEPARLGSGHPPTPIVNIGDPDTSGVNLTSPLHFSNLLHT